MLRGIISALFVIIADQISKALVYSYLLHNAPMVKIYDFFNLVTAWNTGVSFSMLNDLGGYGVYILSSFSLIVIAILLYWLKKEENHFIQYALGFVIGGAFGNVIDRIRIGSVFDFLDFHIGPHHWPAFNVADSFICIGAFMILIGSTCLPCQLNQHKK